MGEMRAQWEDRYAKDPIGAIRGCLTTGPDDPLPPAAQEFVDSLLASGMPPEAACPAPLLAEAVFADMPDGVKFRSFAVPAQPIQHRERLGRSAIGIDACVARPVSHKERRENPKAQTSLDKEWKKLRDINCWEEGKVKEWRDVAAQARSKGTQCHVGRIFAICVEKNAELPESYPSRKFKGRVVFQGNDVRDHNWEVALFQ